jgi:hypothetical protein
MAIHTNERKYKCKCGKAFLYNSSKQAHIKGCKVGSQLV